jgi:hypothetical protein
MTKIESTKCNKCISSGGGDCATCDPTETTEQCELLPSFDQIDDLERQLKFYKDRINYLQCWQSSMRDPERKIVCDILANGFTLTTKEEIDNADRAIREAANKEITVSTVLGYEEGYKVGLEEGKKQERKRIVNGLQKKTFFNGTTWCVSNSDIDDVLEREQ